MAARKPDTAERARESIQLTVQLGVGERCVLEREGCGVASAGGLAVDELMELGHQGPGHTETTTGRAGDLCSISEGMAPPR